jgi:hypothetical protein
MLELKFRDRSASGLGSHADLAYSCHILGPWYVYFVSLKGPGSAFNPFFVIRIFVFQDYPTNCGLSISSHTLLAL